VDYFCIKENQSFKLSYGDISDELGKIEFFPAPEILEKIKINKKTKLKKYKKICTMDSDLW
jgi:hypothetical protein